MALRRCAASQDEHWPELLQQARDEATRLAEEGDELREQVSVLRVEAEQRAQEFAQARSQL